MKWNLAEENRKAAIEQLRKMGKTLKDYPWPEDSNEGICPECGQERKKLSLHVPPGGEKEKEENQPTINKELYGSRHRKRITERRSHG